MTQGIPPSVIDRIADMARSGANAIRSILDPGRYLVDPKITPFFSNQMVDVAAANAVTEQGKYLVATINADTGNVIIIKSFAFYAYARTNVTQSSESVTMISPAEGNNFFQFEVQTGKNGKATTAQTVLDAWTNNSAATSQDKKTSAAFTLITDNPFADVMRNVDSGTMGFVVNDGESAKVLFSLVPEAITGALNGGFVIGTVATESPEQRVDYVGAFLGGVQMSRPHYDQMMRSRLSGW